MATMTTTTTRGIQPIRVMESELEFMQVNVSCMIANDSITDNWMYPGVLDINLTALTAEERIAFKIIVFVLCLLSLFGNISTLGVNIQREMRPVFRACLISLALSDLLSTTFLTTVYFAQFSTEYVQIWVLGDVVCKVVPFVTTTAILASSMTLLLIALDRYFAVMNAFVSHWKPGRISALIYMLGIWIVSSSISCPLFWVYHTVKVYLLTKLDGASLNEKNNIDWRVDVDSLKKSPFYELVMPEHIIKICISDQKDVALYYIIIVSIIFVPSITAFIWINMTIANKIWIRRHRVSLGAEYNHHGVSTQTSNARQTSSDSNTVVNTNSKRTMTNKTNNAGDTASKQKKKKKKKKVISKREQRHIRMVVVIVLLIAIFIFLRLPAWIFLLMRMYGTFSKTHHWLIYFSFGILNLASCALNPLCYTFLHETIQFIECCKMKCRMRSRRLRNYIANCGFQSSEDSSSCACCGLLDRFVEKNQQCDMQDSNGIKNKSYQAEIPGLENDEGVDCSDAEFEDSDDEENEIFDDKNSAEKCCKKEVFTVFSISVVMTPAGDHGIKTIVI